jgi:hypothetical protein
MQLPCNPLEGGLGRMKVRCMSYCGILGGDGARLVTGRLRAGASAFCAEYDELCAGGSEIIVCVMSPLHAVESVIGSSKAGVAMCQVDSTASAMKCARNPVSSSASAVKCARSPVISTSSTVSCAESQVQCASGAMSSASVPVSYAACQVKCAAVQVISPNGTIK